ncbi:hypothetical protein FHC49_08125 [Kluyvera sp. EC_51]|uniref:hypothetical protein n=1 Tax=Kluyvera sp. EC_51 TaxID=2584089 RepID=UPI001C703B2F|nr:hypothetical protein [Kluyvera sp. EC_51]MBW9461320.1 hypothetical protein [Kluyvera sp. EC_51]
MNRTAKWFAVITFISVLAGCARTAPIEQVRSVVAAGHTTDQVKHAILHAGVQREWLMSESAPGTIKATQSTNGHVAIVNINYTSTSYSISYVSSINLKASGGKIHKNYNRWVRNLDKDIRLNLAAMY